MVAMAARPGLTPIRRGAVTWKVSTIGLAEPTPIPPLSGA